MEKVIYDEKNGLWYELQGDYYIPCIKLPEKEALFYDLCKHGKWHKIQNGNRAGKSQGGLLPIIAY